MNKKLPFRCITVMFLFIWIFMSCKGVIEPIDQPTILPNITASSDFTVSANGQTQFTGRAGDVNNGYYSFSSFDFTENAKVRVYSKAAIYSLKIIPTSLGITYNSIDSHTIEFTLPKPEMITILINGNNLNALHIFTSFPETNIPNITDNNVIYFASPKVYNIGILNLKDNQTVYIEKGAKINGMIFIKDAKNIKIIGRGIIDGTNNNTTENYPNGDKPWRLVYIVNSENVEIDGITFYNSQRWSIHCFSSKNIKINNVRIINSNEGSDGVDLSACQDVSITNSFFRTNDDCIAIKATSFNKNELYPNPKVQNQNVKNITVEGCTLWNMAYGNVFEIGYELVCERVSNVTYKNCDVIMQEDRGAVFSIHNADNAVVDSVLYDNIRVENAASGKIGSKLFDLAIFYSLFSYDSYWGNILPNSDWDNLLPAWGQLGSTKYRGQIKNITYRNIYVLDNNLPYSISHGFDNEHTIENVLFENIIFQGKKISDKNTLIFNTNEFVKNIMFQL